MLNVELGNFAPGFVSLRKLMAAAAPDMRMKMFANACVEVAGYVSRGLDRAVAADQLQEMAEAQGLANDHQDEIQEIIHDAFDGVVEQDRVPDDVGKGNGQDHEHAAVIDLIAPYRRDDEGKIPIRDWEVPGLFLRKHVTVLVAPSGSGKSLLTLQVGIACAMGRNWAGWRPRQALRVLVINSEDDAEEIQRRLMAATYRMPTVLNGDPDAYIENFRILDATNASAVIAEFDVRKKKLATTPRFEQIIATIKEGKFDLVIVDPFAETFDLDENSNNELKQAGVLWRRVAREANVAICLVHHTKKYATGMAGDVDAARGAGALIGIARIVSTLFPMTAKESEVMLGDAKKADRGYYLRYDDAKANLNIISPHARWFRKETIVLNNPSGDLPGDEVGVLIPWKPEGPSVMEAQILAFFARVDQGMLDDNGAPLNEFYTLEKAGRGNERYVALFAQEYFKLDAISQAEKLIEPWIKNKRLRVGPQYKSPHTRKMRSRCISELNPLAQKQAPTNGGDEAQQSFV